MSNPRILPGLLRHRPLRPFTFSPQVRTARLPAPSFSRAQILCTSLLAFPLAVSPSWRNPALADSFSTSSPVDDYKKNAQTPIIKNDGSWNTKALRQISAGSIFGLIGGVVVSIFSKPLAVLIGLGVFGVQVGLLLLPPVPGGKRVWWKANSEVTGAGVKRHTPRSLRADTEILQEHQREGRHVK